MMALEQLEDANFELILGWWTCFVHFRIGFMAGDELVCDARDLLVELHPSVLWESAPERFYSLRRRHI
jgi:hypothetical protein